MVTYLLCPETSVSHFRTGGTLSTLRMSLHSKAPINCRTIFFRTTALLIHTSLSLALMESPYIHRFHVKENTPAGAVLGQMMGSRPLSFTSLAEKPLSDYFTISPINGSIITLKQIDRESICHDNEINNASVESHSKNNPNCEVAFLVHVTTSETSLLETVYLTILDVNDNPPVFPSPSITLVIPESSPVGSHLHLPAATDADVGINGISHYYLSRIYSETLPQACPSRTSVEDSFFTLSMTAENTPQLRQIEELNYEKMHRIFYCLHAYDGEGLTATLFITFEIQDVNDNGPQWVGLPYQVRLPECSQRYHQTVWKTSSELRNFARVNGFTFDTPFRFLIQLVATDADSGEFGKITFKVVQKAMEPKSSHKAIIYGDKLYLIGPVDFELTPKFSIPVEARDGGGLTNVTDVEIILEDCNDNAPQISIKSLNPLPEEKIADWGLYKQVDIWIEEEDEDERKLATVTVSDADTGENAAVDCDVEWNSLMGANPFRLVPLKATLTTLKVPSVYMLVKGQGVKLDREVSPRVQVAVICADRGQPQANIARKTITVGVLDINDNAPKFRDPSMTNLSVPENDPVGSVLGYIKVFDADVGKNAELSYNLENCETENTTELFSIDRGSGKITSLKTFDREKKSSYCVNIIAQDMGEPSLTSQTKINISIIDVNDSPPKFEGNHNESGRIVFELPESFGQQRFTERYIGQINATDADLGVNGTLEFSLKVTTGQVWQFSRQAHFRINRRGQLIVNGILDREKAPEYDLTVLVTDSGQSHQRLSSEIGVTVRLQDQNDNGPVFTQPPADLTDSNLNVATINLTQSIPANSSMYRICAKDEDIGENANVNFTLRSAKYLKPFFDLAPAEPANEKETCVDLMLMQKLQEMFQDSEKSRRPVEHQLYVTATDVGSKKFTKTARIRIFVVTDSAKETVPFSKNTKTETTNRETTTTSTKQSKSDNTVASKTEQSRFPAFRVSTSKRTEPTARPAAAGVSFFGQARAKYLFAVAVVIFLMFLIVLGLLAYLFLRDIPTKRQTLQQNRNVTTADSNFQQYPDSHAIPIVYSSDFPEGEHFMLETTQGVFSDAPII